VTPPTRGRVIAAATPTWVDGFLTPVACARALDELDFAFWRPSTVVNRARDGSVYSHVSLVRVSETTSESWFTPELRALLRRVERRLCTKLGVERNRFEEWQAVRYRRGGRFDYHLDAGFWSGEPAGEREWTVLLYLDTPPAGGATRFKELGLDVQAVAGRLLVWNNLLEPGIANPWMLHAGAPVRRGCKTILVTWIRERPARPT
jgi:prolyl 4-hydroxylase